MTRTSVEIRSPDRSHGVRLTLRDEEPVVGLVDLDVLVWLDGLSGRGRVSLLADTLDRLAGLARGPADGAPGWEIEPTTGFHLALSPGLREVRVALRTASGAALEGGFPLDLRRTPALVRQVERLVEGRAPVEVQLEGGGSSLRLTAFEADEQPQMPAVRVDVALELDGESAAGHVFAATQVVWIEVDALAAFASALEQGRPARLAAMSPDALDLAVGDGRVRVSVVACGFGPERIQRRLEGSFALEVHPSRVAEGVRALRAFCRVP